MRSWARRTLSPFPQAPTSSADVIGQGAEDPVLRAFGALSAMLLRRRSFRTSRTGVDSEVLYFLIVLHWNLVFLLPCRTVSKEVNNGAAVKLRAQSHDASGRVALRLHLSRRNRFD